MKRDLNLPFGISCGTGLLAKNTFAWFPLLITLQSMPGDRQEPPLIARVSVYSRCRVEYQLVAPLGHLVTAIPLLRSFRSVDVVGNREEIQFPEIGRSLVCGIGTVRKGESLIAIRKEELLERDRIGRLGLEVWRQDRMSVHDPQIAILSFVTDGCSSNFIEDR